jgi:anti-sigma factor RsiW
MDKLTPESDDLLLRYIDGALNQSERQQIEKDLEQNEILRKRLEHLRSTHLLLRANRMDQPSKNFTQLVMMRLNHDPIRGTSFPIRNSILLLAGVLLVAIIASVLVPAGVFDNITTTIDLNQVELPKKYIERTLPSISINGKLMVNLIIMVNLVLGWIVLDRAILRPLFQRRIQPGR